MTETNIVFKDKRFSLSYEDVFSDGLSLDDYLSTDYGNIEGELITFPLIFAKIGLLLSEAEKAAKEAKLELDLKEAILADSIRKENEDKKLSDAKIQALVKVNEEYIALCNNRIEKEYELSVLDKIYWAAKDKSKKIEILHRPFEQTDSEIVESQVNKINIKRKKSIFDHN